MRILVSNDDGVYAPGLLMLAQVLSEFAAITVVAPDRNRSGASNSLTLDNPIRLNKLDNGFYSVEGTPTDCVHLALTGLIPEIPDMVVAGINSGANLGDDVFYSGTVAAATEGRFLGLPAIAVSLVHNSGHQTLEHYATAAALTKKIILQLKNDPLPAKTILNINVPDIPIENIKGYAITRLGSRHTAEPIVHGKDPRGNNIYWVGPPGSEADAGQGTDFHAVSDGYASITPLLLDLTHYKVFDQVAGWLNGIK